MKRKAKYKAWFWGEYSKGTVTPELLQAVGHLSFLWNDVEEALDRAVAWSIDVPVNLQIEVRSRIQGLDGKIEIVKAAVNETTFLESTTKADVLATLGGFQGFKERRDAVMHARASEIYNGVARTFERRGAVFEVLLTIDALNSLNSHMEIFNIEMAALAGVLGGITRMGRLLQKEITKQITEKGQHAEKLRPIAQSDQSYLLKLRDCQRQRKALPPPPELPQEVQNPSGQAKLQPLQKLLSDEPPK